LIRQNVSKQVGRYDNVKLPGIHHQLLRASVDDPVIHFDAAFILLGDGLAALKEEAC